MFSVLLFLSCAPESVVPQPAEPAAKAKPQLPRSHEVAVQIVENLHDTDKLLGFIPSDQQLESLLKCERDNPLVISIRAFRQQIMNRPKEMQKLSTKVIRVEQTNEKTTPKGKSDTNCQVIEDLTIRFMTVKALVKEDERPKEKNIPVTLIKIKEDWFFSSNPAKDMMEKAKVQEVQLQFKRLSKAILAYRSEHKKTPSSLDLIGKYLRNGELPKDPWDSDFKYSKSEACQWQLTSKGTDGVLHTFDDIVYCEPK